MVVVLLGPPGVGKGTQAVRLADQVGAAHVSTGDLLRAARRDGTELGKKAQSYMDAGEYVPDDLILDLVREHLATLPEDAPVLFDGFPRTPAQAEGLDAALAADDRQVDAVVVFEAPDDTRFPALRLARAALRAGGTAPITLNAANEEAVAAFLAGRLGFLGIPEVVERTLEAHPSAPLDSLEDVDAVDALARRTARGLLEAGALQP